jgi:hypothetical protein
MGSRRHSTIRLKPFFKAVAACVLCGQALMPLGAAGQSGFTPFQISDRAAPLTSISVGKTIDLTGHGLKTGKENDALPILRKIPEWVKGAGGPVEIRLAPGTYYLGDGWDPADPDFAVKITGAKDVVIDGCGAALVIRNPRLGFLHLVACERVLVRNLSIDYDPLPFTQGFVESIEGATVTVSLQEGFPTPDLPWFRQAKDQFSGIRLKSDPVRTKPGQRHTLPYKKITPAEPGRYQLHTYSPDHVGNMKPGDPIWIIARQNGRAAFAANFSSDVTFQGITVFASPTVAFALFMSTRCAVLSCRTDIKPGRWISVNADVVHAHRNRIGPVVAGCAFYGCIDDVMNIYNYALRLAKISDPKTIEVQGFAGPPEMLPTLLGTPLEIIDPETGKTVYAGKIEAISRPANPAIRVEPPLELDDPSFFRPENPQSAWTAHGVYLMAQMSSGFRIVSNVIAHGHRFGVILPSSDGLVEGNTFEDVSASAIAMQNRMDVWPNEIKFHARGRLIIRSNLITACNTSHTAIDQNAPGAIQLSFQNRTFETAPGYELTDLLVEGNRIVDCPGPSIFIGAARNAGVFGNVSSGANATGLQLRNVSGARIAGNSKLRVDSDASVRGLIRE